MVFWQIFGTKHYRENLNPDFIPQPKKNINMNIKNAIPKINNIFIHNLYFLVNINPKPINKQARIKIPKKIGGPK